MKAKIEETPEKDFRDLMESMGGMIERNHRAIVEGFKRLGCPPELVILYDVIPCTTSHTLALAAIREGWRREDYAL